MKNIHIIYGDRYPARYSLAAIEGISEMAELGRLEYKVSLVETGAANTKAIEDFFYNRRSGKYNEYLFFRDALPAIYKWLGLKGDGNSSAFYLLEGDLYYYKSRNEPCWNWMFGAANIYGGIETPFRFELRFKDESPEFRAEMFKTIVMHEIGHTFGLVDESAPNHTRSKNPIYHGHCRDRDCIMSQNVRLANEMKRTKARLSRGAPLCPECLEYMVERNRAR